MDFLLPPDLAQAKATISLDANTASFSSPTVGSTRSIERLGDRLRINFDFTVTNDNVNTARQRGRMQAFLSGLRGQSSRVYMSPPGAVLRGSFPAPELLSNNTFVNGTTGWIGWAPGTDVLSVQDRILRVKRTGSGLYLSCQQGMSLAINVPYAVRGMYIPGTGPMFVIVQLNSVTQNFNLAFVGNYQSVPALFNTLAGGVTFFIYEGSATGGVAGDYFDVPWASVSRCALVDNGVNLLLNSDTPGSGTGWSLTAATAAANGTAGPDGSVSAWGLTETTANSAHFASQTVTVAAAAADYTFSVFVQQLGSPRGFCWVQISESIGSTSTSAYLNLATGAITNIGTGANWAAISAVSVNYGNGWWRLILTARKTNAATTLSVLVGTATAAGTNTYVGSTSAYVLAWRASFAQSSVPVAPIGTTSAAALGTLQTGLPLNLKGLPPSSQGLLLSGDWVECNGQLNQVVASLDSDAAGLGIVRLARPFRNSPADGAPLIINNPMGKFMVNSNTTSWNEQPGAISDATIEFVEDIAF